MTLWLLNHVYREPAKVILHLVGPLFGVRGTAGILLGISLLCSMISTYLSDSGITVWSLIVVAWTHGSLAYVIFKVIPGEEEEGLPLLPLPTRFLLVIAAIATGVSGAALFTAGIHLVLGPLSKVFGLALGATSVWFLAITCILMSLPAPPRIRLTEAEPSAT